MNIGQFSFSTVSDIIKNLLYCFNVLEIRPKFLSTYYSIYVIKRRNFVAHVYSRFWESTRKKELKCLVLCYKYVTIILKLIY